MSVHNSPRDWEPCKNQETLLARGIVGTPLVCKSLLQISALHAHTCTQISTPFSSIIHFIQCAAVHVVTDWDEAGVDLTLIEPFLLYYVYHIVLNMLASSFKLNFHQKMTKVCITFGYILGSQAYWVRTPNATGLWFQNARCRIECPLPITS